MNRRGGSLLFVLITLVFLGGVAGILFSMARLRWLGGTAALRSARVQVAAYAESERALAAWDAVRADSVAIGGSAALPGLIGPGGLSSRDSLRRLDRSLYFLTILAELRNREGALLARGGVARLVSLAVAEVSDSQALTAVRPVTLEGSPAIDGTDRSPAGWGACPSAPPVGAPAVRSSLVAPVEGNCPGGGCLIGLPPTLLDSTLRPGFLDQLGPISFADLADLADLEISGNVAGIGTAVPGTPCDQNLPGNWGDPSSSTGACSRYFPLILAGDGTRIEGAAAQGVLLGSGRLELAGDLAFHGVVLARGSVTLRDRARVIGTVLAEDTVKLLDLARIERSTCAVRRALAGAGRPRRRVDRGWIRWP